jgi:hypothetical protein
MTKPGRPPGLPKTGGRKRGSLDKAARSLITEKVAGDILTTYKKLGSQKFLLEWAQQNQTEFIRQCLARLMPPMPRDSDDTAVNNTQINIGQISEIEAAMRIAFVLRLGLQRQEEQAQPVAERIPTEPELPSLDEVKVTMPPTDCERHEQVSLATRRGSRAEQGTMRAPTRD